MASPTPRRVPGKRRAPALLGLAGAALSALGDVLILGRPCSGRDFDRATGQVPPHVEVDERWRSLWNGVGLPAARVHVGAVVGCIGIGLLQGPALRGLARTLPAGRARSVATASAWVFAVAGVLTHQCCASLVLAHQRAVATAGLTAVPPRVPRTLTTLLAVSAAGSLAALAGSSAATTVAGPGSLGDRTRRAAGTPFPWVLAALLTSSALPAPVGGYVRPASISSGLLASFALTALAARRVRPVGR